MKIRKSDANWGHIIATSAPDISWHTRIFKKGDRKGPIETRIGAHSKLCTVEGCNRGPCLWHVGSAYFCKAHKAEAQAARINAIIKHDYLFVKFGK